MEETELFFDSLYLALTNVVKSFTIDFEPTLFPSESEDITGLRSLIYSIALLSSPFCTAIASAQLANHFFPVFRFIPKKFKKNHVIFGNTPRAHLLVQNTPSDTKTYLFTDDTLDPEIQKVLLQKNCHVKSFDPKQDESLLHKANHIFLLEEDSLKNAVLYINSSQYNQEQMLKFYALCQEEAAVNLIKGYHDEENVNARSEVQLINVNQLKLDSLFQKHPLIADESLHSGQLDVHVLVVGFDHLCKQAVLHILNEGVLSSESTIKIQIIYQEEGDKERFLNHFSCQFSQKDFTAYNYRLDGNLEIHFHQCSTVSRQLLIDITQDSLLTYTIINQGDVAQDIYAASIIKDFTNATIAINFASQDEISRYFQSNTKYFSNFVTFLTDNEVMCTDFICNDALLRTHKEYNFWYEKLAGVFSGWPCEDSLEESWAKLDFYKKESNCFAYYHKKCKERIVPSDLKAQVTALLGKETLDALLQDKKLDSNPDCEQIILKLRKNPALYELLALEHRRWNYFAATQGWKYGETKIADLKLTPYLVDFDTLCRERPDIACYDLLGYLAFCNN